MGNNSNVSESHQERVSIPQQKKEVIKESSKQSYTRKTVYIIKKEEIKYELNIYIYSNLDNNNYIIDYLFNLNNPILDFTTMNIKGKFSKQNSDLLIESFKEEKNYKNVIIIPINSISDFQKTIESKDKNEYKEKNILQHFNKSLNFTLQPFFILIDFYEKDFIIESLVIEKNFVLSKYYQLKRIGTDFEIVFTININRNGQDKIDIFKNIVLTKKKKLDDFSLSINEQYYYNILFEKEDLIELDKLLKVFDDKYIDVFKITLVLINQNSNFSEELVEYEKLEREISKVTFNYYYFKKEKLNNILNKYKLLDERNFMVQRARKSPKDKLIKYACFYNHFDDILYCDQNSYYPVKINIAVGGLSGSGKSTLINGIFGEKRCEEKKGSSTYQYTLKDYALSFIEFPDSPNYINNIEKTINEMNKINEEIHCFIFCINFEEPSFNEKTTEKIFNALFKFELKTFFVVTKSEKPETNDFKNLKNNIIETINNIKTKYPENKVKKVFGDNIQNQIIPVLSITKQSNNKIKYKFGLDRLFESLFTYFNKKKINIEGEKDIKDIISKNELLRLYIHKDEFLKRAYEKMELQSYNFIFKSIILNPDYLNNKSIDSIYQMYDNAYDNILIIYKHLIDLLNEEEKFQIYKILKNPRITVEEIKSIIETKEFEEMLKGIENQNKDNKSNANMSLIKYYSSKLSKLLAKKFWNKIMNDNETEYFKGIIDTLNKAISDLLEMEKYFEGYYLEHKFKM